MRLQLRAASTGERARAHRLAQPRPHIPPLRLRLATAHLQIQPASREVSWLGHPLQPLRFALPGADGLLTTQRHTLPVGASADLAAVATEIAEQVRLLDGLVRYRFGDNAELMGAWSSARIVLGRSGPGASRPRGRGEAVSLCPTSRPSAQLP